MIKVYDNLNEMVLEYGKPFLSKNELIGNNLNHILIRGNGRIKFSLLTDKAESVSIIEKDFRELMEEKINGYVGIYGIYGASSKLLDEMKEFHPDKFITIMEYEGPYYAVNSGIYEGYVIITSNFQDIEFDTVSS